jgi:phosphoribosylformimino-5-aminoimidazole carboxamide ribotide isomerase
MLAGPGLPMYEMLCAAVPAVRVQASGGVRDADDVAAVRAAGCAGVVLGKALLESRLSLREALAPC